MQGWVWMLGGLQWEKLGVVTDVAPIFTLVFRTPFSCRPSPLPFHDRLFH
jgi:hypothetical protein